MFSMTRPLTSYFCIALSLFLLHGCKNTLATPEPAVTLSSAPSNDPLLPKEAVISNTQTAKPPSVSEKPVPHEPATACTTLKIKTVDRRSGIEIDENNLPKKLKEGHRTFKRHCTKCHSQDRTIEYLQQCTSKSRDDFEFGLKKTIAKKTRLAGNKMTKADAKSVQEFLLALYKVGSR